MSGGISQLVAQGVQDTHLTGDPQVSFFRSSFKRYTHFADVRNQQVIRGNPGPGATSSVRFERRGDLLNGVYLTKKDAGVIQGNIANDVEKVELYIGGQLIDSHDKDYLTTVWRSVEAPDTNRAVANTDFLPLHFFFCDNTSSALPLVALQYHDVEIKIYWTSAVVSGGTNSYECWANFVYLDTTEREWFNSTSHNMLIKQVQTSQASNESVQELVFNHPVAYIATKTASAITAGNELQTKMSMKINGTDLGEPMEITPHFNKVPMYYHTKTALSQTKPLFLISFANDLSKYQPTGSLNFSRLDSARLISHDSTKNFNTTIYAINYNVLKIQNGMGGLMFSN
jgi:hypothetical protein